LAGPPISGGQYKPLISGAGDSTDVCSVDQVG
jgi:hypothetical protein